jgi:hypothetical protein
MRKTASNQCAWNGQQQATAALAAMENLTSQEGIQTAAIAPLEGHLIASSVAYSSPTLSTPDRRAVPLRAVVLLAAAVHAPLLLLELPVRSYDANLHMFFASHYAHHWFNPWNEKWFTGFSQTTYPPLEHYWIALFSYFMSLVAAYMLVQLIAILLLPVGMYRFARIWVDERSASYAAIGSVFLGSLAFLVYQSGQLPTTLAAALYLNALPYFYEWMTQSRWRALLKGAVLCVATAAAHHVTLLFGAVLFALPVLCLALLDRKREGNDSAAASVISRSIIFMMVAAPGVVLTLLPYLIEMYRHPIKQIPIPHASRANFLADPAAGFNFFIIPFGALLLALPYIFAKGSTNRRLLPLFAGFWLTFMLALGGTTPLPRWLFGRVWEILTYERFTFWATLMALPITGLLVNWMIERFNSRGAIAAWLFAVASFGCAVGWTVWHPISVDAFNITPIVNFMNRDNHNQFRYMTLGFGNLFSKVSTYADASSVDGEYNAARLLPEMNQYGSAQLTNSKFFGTAGMESLRAMLKHANKYGLKYIFVRDKYYEPLLAFAGWRKTEIYDDGLVSLWSKDDVGPAHKMEYGDVPPPWQGIMWGTLPIGSSVLAIVLLLALPEKRRRAETIDFPASSKETVYAREAK